MTTTPAKAALLAGVLSLAGFAAASAATPPAPPPPGAPDAKVERRVMMKRVGPDGMAMRMHRDPEARAQRMRDVLQLTPQQEPALQAFLTAMKPEMRMERRERPAADAPKPAPLTTPERLDKQLERMAKRQEAFTKRAAATKTFYAQLSPSQKKAFDALHRGGRGDGPRVRMFRHGGPGGPGPMVMGALAQPQASAETVVAGDPAKTIVVSGDEDIELAMLDDGLFDEALFLDEDF